MGSLILSNPEEYSAAVLGSAPEDYVQNMLNPKQWFVPDRTGPSPSWEVFDFFSSVHAGDLACVHDVREWPILGTRRVVLVITFLSFPVIFH